MKGSTTMKIGIGNGGWCILRPDADDSDFQLPGRVYVRVQDIDGVDRITEVYIDGRGEPIQPGGLRRFPLAVAEQQLSGLTEGRRGTPGPDLSRLATFIATVWGTGAYAGRHCETCSAPLQSIQGQSALVNWPALSWYAQFPDNDIPQVPEHKLVRTTSPSAPEVKLSYESGQALTDAFLTDVARAYEAAIARGLPPAVAIAEQVRVEQKTVQSWIYKARKRGLVPPPKSRGRIV
jgi:hypothetical protein